VDADADDITGMDGFRVDLFERFIDEDGVANDGGCGSSENEEPTWRNDCGPKRIIAGIYKVNTQESILPSCKK
jgi:hypothetical protein